MCRYVFKHLYGDLTTHTVCTVVIVVSRKSEPEVACSFCSFGTWLDMGVEFSRAKEHDQFQVRSLSIHIDTKVIPKPH
jgi:hypothetical protein